jgi:ArsR family transcriptional regulator, lead/cadmium/zinc/bismuth-responsive transcriptional repressor
MSNRSDIITVQPEVLEEQPAAALAELFSALSDPSRVRIISALFGAEQSVGALAQAVGLSESAVSHQLRGLRQLKLVRTRRAGRQVFYRLADTHISDLYQRGLEHILHG